VAQSVGDIGSGRRARLARVLSGGRDGESDRPCSLRGAPGAGCDALRLTASGTPIGGNLQPSSTEAASSTRHNPVRVRAPLTRLRRLVAAYEY